MARATQPTQGRWAARLGESASECQDCGEYDRMKKRRGSCGLVLSHISGIHDGGDVQ